MSFYTWLKDRLKDDGVLEDRFDMTGLKEKEHLVSIAPYEGTR